MYHTECLPLAFPINRGPLWATICGIVDYKFWRYLVEILGARIFCKLYFMHQLHHQYLFCFKSLHISDWKTLAKTTYWRVAAGDHPVVKQTLLFLSRPLPTACSLLVSPCFSFLLKQLICGSPEESNSVPDKWLSWVFFYTDVKEWKSQSGFAWYIQALHDGVKSSLISMPILISIVFTWRRSPIHCFSFVGVKHLGFQLTLLKEGLFWVISDWSKVLCSIWCQFKLAPLTKRWKAWPLGRFWVISGAERFPDSWWPLLPLLLLTRARAPPLASRAHQSGQISHLPNRMWNYYSKK